MGVEPVRIYVWVRPQQSIWCTWIQCPSLPRLVLSLGLSEEEEDKSLSSMLELEPPVHTRLRGLVLRAFTSRRIAELAPEIEELSHKLVQDFPDGPFDLIEYYCAKVPVIVIANLLGVPVEMTITGTLAQ